LAKSSINCDGFDIDIDIDGDCCGEEDEDEDGHNNKPTM